MLTNKGIEVLYITRKYPPSVGGMQRLSFELRQSLSQIVNLRLIAWGYSQKWLPFFLTYALGRAIGYLMTQPNLKVILIGDPVLAPLALTLKLIFRRPVLVVIHGLDITYPNRFYQTFVLGSLKRLDAFVCISQGTRREAIRRGLPDRRCTVIPVGIDPGRFSQNNPLSVDILARWPGILAPENKVILLTVGRLVKRKGVTWFIEQVLSSLIAEYPQVHYIIVGQGPQQAEIEASIQRWQLTDKVTLCGEVSELELQALYQMAHIFVMPNIPVAGDMEGFGIVALEATLNLTCVVAAKLEGIEEAITDQENGWLVPAGDAEEFLKILKLLVTDHEIRQQFSKKARDFTLTHFKWACITERYVKIIDELIDPNVN